ncbi:MAG: hypothetical protein KC609_00345, partial [Myxococcales bacterium]|nr:hypothetical protein [Myxococcales bacterium]
MKKQQFMWQVLVVWITLTSLVATATAKVDEVPRRMVGGHHFTPSLLVDYPMVVSRVGSFIGAGY